jgi:plastocyanin
MSDLNEPTTRDAAAADAVQSKEKAWHEWMGIAVGLTGVLSILAIIVSVAALSASNSGASAQAAPVPAPSSATAPTSVAPAPKPEAVKLLVKADDEHAKRGPDGKWHDAFLPADFAVHPGDKVTVTVENYDGGPHTFTSPAMGVNAIIPGGGSLASPREVTFTFTAPKKAGRYQWFCAVPCDPWSMAHNGYMRGFVTVAA